MNETRRDIRVGVFIAFIGIFLFALSVPMTKWALESFDPFFTATGRATIAGVISFFILTIRREKFVRKDLRRPLFFTALGAVFGWPILIALALERTTSAHVSVIAAVMPLVTAVLAVIRRRQHVPTQFWAAAVMGTIGLIIFSITRAGVGNADPIADLLIIGAVFFSAYCYVEGAILSREIAGWKVSSWIVLVTLPINIVASLIIWSHTHNHYTLTAKGIFGLFYIGMISMYFGFWFWYHGLAKAGTVRGSQVQQLQALMTLFWSAILLGEKVTIATVAAALFVIGCVAWAQIVSYRSAQ